MYHEDEILADLYEVPANMLGSLQKNRFAINQVPKGLIVLVKDKNLGRHCRSGKILSNGTKNPNKYSFAPLIGYEEGQKKFENPIELNFKDLEGLIIDFTRI